MIVIDVAIICDGSINRLAWLDLLFIIIFLDIKYFDLNFFQIIIIVILLLLPISLSFE